MRNHSTARSRRTVRLALASAAVAGLAFAAPATAGDRGSSAPSVQDAPAYSKLVEVWASDVRLHVEPTVGSPSPTTFGPGTLEGHCQKKGDRVTEPGQGSSEWWTYANLPEGSDTLFISNVYLVGGEKIEGIPDC